MGVEFNFSGESRALRRFEGKVVVVTGSGTPDGLGHGILRRFADEGALCVVVDSHGDAGNECEAADQIDSVVEELRSRGTDAICFSCDVTDEAEAGGLIDGTVAEFGRIDVLINHAGIEAGMKPFLETGLREWSSVMGTILTAAFLASKHAARAMIARGEGGRIINIGSQAARSGYPHLAPYCAARHGLIGLTRSNAAELGVHGITVNAVCPAHVTTGLDVSSRQRMSRALGFESLETYLEHVHTRNPMRRAGMPSDTAAACAWLASEDAAYVTGQALNVSGGDEMH